MTMQPQDPTIGAIVLAAGLSQRMGEPKMVLPWGSTTVIGRVVQVLAQAGAGNILVVTGGAHEQVESALQGFSAQTVYNPRHMEDQMLFSLQIGLACLPAAFQAALVALGDQPQIQGSVVEAVLGAYRLSHSPLVVPSYHMRRGHPWLIDRSLWGEVITQQSPKTLRDLLNDHAGDIHYVSVDTDSILHDLDTQADYAHYRPNPGS